MHQEHDDPNIIAIAREIRQYLEQYPEAADTLEGIAQWWLTQQQSQQALDTVKQALDRLVVEGIVKKYITAEGKTVYSGAKRDSVQSD